MGRWAWGDEVACFTGGCRNLAEWLILHEENPRLWDRYGLRAAANQPVCWLHLDSAQRLLVQRSSLGVRLSVVPFQDPTAPPRRKRRWRRPPVIPV